MSPEFEKQILVAGVGNAWMLDDGFGSVVAQRLEAREMPPGVRVMYAGSGGLGHPVGAEHEHAAGLVERGRGASRGRCT